jgi:hypothetical protein
MAGAPVTVYILLRETDHEGGDVLGVYGTEDKAKAAMADYISRDHYRDRWEPLPDTTSYREGRDTLCIDPHTLDQIHEHSER